ncbi:MAG: glycoside hydrolase family 125 protein, partial [Turicibacter sp.]
LISDDKEEIEFLIQTLLSTDGDTKYRHESFNVNEPKDVTRPWFACANSIFTAFIHKKYL